MQPGDGLIIFAAYTACIRLVYICIMLLFLMIGIISLITYLLSDMTQAEATAEETSIKVNTKQNKILQQTERRNSDDHLSVRLSINIEEGCRRSVSV